MQQPSGTPMKRAGDMILLVVARRDEFGLLPCAHPARSNLRVQMNIDFVLKHDGLVLGQTRNQPLDFPQFCLVFVVVRTNHRTRPSPDKVHAVQSATHGQGADMHTFLLSKQRRQNRARPARSEVGVVARRTLQQPSHHDHQPRGHGDNRITRSEYSLDTARNKIAFDRADQSGARQCGSAQLPARHSIREAQRN